MLFYGPDKEMEAAVFSDDVDSCRLILPNGFSGTRKEVDLRQFLDS